MSAFTDMQRELFASSNDFLMKVSRGELSYLFPNSSKEVTVKREKTPDKGLTEKITENVPSNPDEELNEIRKCTYDDEDSIEEK